MLCFNFFLFIFFICVTGKKILVNEGSRVQVQTCEGLIVSESQNLEVTCKSQTQIVATNCKEPQAVGTVANVKCKAHHVFHEQRRPDETYISVNSRDSMQQLVCAGNGTWTNLVKLKSYKCVEDCGRRIAHPKPLIINGVQTESISWPWHAALFRRNGTRIKYLCGGSIILKSAVLTAAHCVSTFRGDAIMPNTTVVLVGAVSSNFTEIPYFNQEVQILNIKKIFVLPSYDPRKEFQGDIAVIQLAETIEFNDRISPVCLPFPNESGTDELGRNMEGKSGDVVGFGVDETGAISKTLKHAKLEIQSHSDCFLKLDRILSESQFCAGSKRSDNTTITVCNGDSGGGFVLPSFIHDKYFILGIVSSGEGISSTGDFCQNFAVFTLVTSFVPWIEEVLDEISEDTNMGRNVFTTFPYSQTGREGGRQVFVPIPRAWKNRVSSLNLSYVDMEPVDLLKSLQLCKTIESINLAHVKFIGTNPFPTRKVRLPQLRSIFVDILREDFKVTKDLRFPQVFSREFLQSLVFFEKDVAEYDFDFKDILLLKTNMRIQVHIFRLVDIDHNSGKLVVSQIPLSNQILRNGIPFTLRELALSRCFLNTRILAGQVGLESLVLDHVNLNLAPAEFGQFLKKQTGLKELVIVVLASFGHEFELDFNDIPKSVKHLALTRVKLLNIPAKNSSLPIMRMRRNDLSLSIRFPDFHSTIYNFQSQLNVETFYCSSCQLSINSIQDLAFAFPEVKNLTLLATSSPTKMLQICNRNLYLLHNVELVYCSHLPTNSITPVVNKFVKLGNNISRNAFSKSVLEGFELMGENFKQNRLGYFWSSEAEYSGLTRIPQIEREAFETGNYKLNGNKLPFENGTIRPLSNAYEDSLPLIPRFVQERLDTIEINNMNMSYDIFVDSLMFCKKLTQVRLVNVTSTNAIFKDRAELPELGRLIDYFVITTTTITFPQFGYKDYNLHFHSVFHQLFPFKAIGYNFRTTLLQTTLQRFHFQFGECIELKWDKNMGILVSSFSYTNDWLRNLPKSVQVKKLAFKYQELDSGVIPESVTHLNLNFAVVRNFGIMLRRIAALKELRFINVRLMPGDDHKNWEWPILNLGELAVHTNSLEFLSLAKARVLNYRKGVSFIKLNTLYLEQCAVEIEIGQNFESIFPQLKNLILLPTENESKESQSLILYNALTTGHVKWILGTTNSFSYDNSANQFNSSELLKTITEIAGILKRANVDARNSKYFIIERKVGSWLGRNVAEKRIRPLLDKLKGLQDFGAARQCHAN